MPVHDAEDTLRYRIEEVLTELVADQPIDATYHLCVIPQVVECEGDHLDDDEPHLMERLFWRLNLHLIMNGERFIVINGLLPYEACYDGDPEPMTDLLQNMWKEHQFYLLMKEKDFDSELEKVAAEITGLDTE